MRRIAILVVIATTACGRIGFESHDAGAPFAIERVTPGWSTPAGIAIDITLTGDVPAVPIVSVDGLPCTGITRQPTGLACTAPPHAAASVMLTVSDASATASARFVYQAPGIVQIGGPLDDRTSGIAVDGQGNIFVAGGTLDGLDGPNQGDYDAVVVKIDASGIVAWTRQLGGPLYDYARDVACDAAGNVTIVGHTMSSLGGPNAGGDDVFVARYAPDGTQLWVTQLGTPAVDQAWDVGTDASLAALVAIQTSGDLGAPNAGGEDYALARISAAGSVDWIRQGGGISTDDGHSVAVAPDGTAFLVGWTSGALDGASAGGLDMFITRFDADGTQQWIRQRGGAGDDPAQDAQLDITGDIWVAGYTTAAIDGEPFAGSQDVYAMHFAPDGTWDFTRAYGGPGFESSFGITATAFGAVLECNTDTAFDGQPALGGDDVCAVALERDGTRRWTRMFGGPTNDQASSIAYDAALTDFVYISAITDGSLDGAPPRGITDFAIMKIDDTGTLR